MSRVLVTAGLDYVAGHLRYGHYELEVDKDTWDSLSDEEKLELIEDEGELVIDDWEIDDYGEIGEIVTRDIQ